MHTYSYFISFAFWFLNLYPVCVYGNVSFLFYSYICFWLCWVFVAVQTFSLTLIRVRVKVREKLGLVGLVVMCKLLIVVVSFYCGAQALGHAGFSSCGMWAQ